MMSKKQLGLSLLTDLQAMHQQKIISSFDKSEVAILIMKAMKNGKFDRVHDRLEDAECLIEEKKFLIEKALQKIEKEGEYYYG